MNNCDTEFSVEIDGTIFQYCMEREYEEDNVKNFHYLFRVLEQSMEPIKNFDWSPYSWVGEKDIRLWIECGMPSRLENNNSNFNTASMELYAQNKGI